MDLAHPYGALQRRWRLRRMRDFMQRHNVSARTQVLDVGGDEFNWALLASAGLPVPRVTVVNLFPPNAPLGHVAHWVVGNATRLPFPDHSFDVAFSNSVVEHLGSAEAQSCFAAELRRVARSYWVQTPNRWFPMEPHLMCPFIHYLPRSLQRPLYPLTPWALLNRNLTAADLDRQFAELRLLTANDLRSLFPGATLLTERVAGLAKSFVATA